jgi:hypothetical protein
MTTLPNYQQTGGIHPETAGLANVLAAKGIVAPHTGRPYTEAMLLGIGGGLGFGYILWEFQAHQIKVLVLAFQNNWQYPVKFYETLCGRLGLTFSLHETGSRRAADGALLDALARGTPVIAWVDRASMPYLQLPEMMIGHIGHFVTVCGLDDNQVLIDDLAARPLPVPAEAFAAARARIGSYKNRLLMVEGAATGIDLEAAIKEGIAYCVEHLGSGSESFSLPAIRKWARTMTDEKNKKGWPRVFQARRGLYSTLASLFEVIELQGEPGGLRGLYADFLLEAAAVINKPGLKEPAGHYAALAAQWHALAEEALPDAVPQFRRAKLLLRERNDVLLQGGDAWRATQATSEELRALRTEGNLNFPLNDEEVAGLFATLQMRLLAIYKAEVEALEALRGQVK